MSKLEPFIIEGEKFFYSLSFDIDDFIGDGIWWIQFYDGNRNLICDEPFASSRGKIDERKNERMIKEDFLAYRGAIL